MSSDFRIFKFNKGTFDECIGKGYDLHYPPVNIININYVNSFIYK